jgi:hypothetical protein
MTFFFSQAKLRSEDGRVFFSRKRTVERKKERDQRGLMNDD